ncbi:MAG: UDP-N-acetylmuramoyl-L-alanyl-D-glutamate--2,6-diaminopimelate ligase [Ruminococcaceae bacterium]|nr:UDP-N-acetylmuramoyl-L-alanyl-D-glutamate--2,6-diaminopimelate ligase [Oscillospiraceae bacterium]
MKLKFLCDAAGIDCPARYADLTIDSIESDSRYVQAGALFVCIRGLHTDGHTYIADACAAGAVCILAEADALIGEETKIPILRVLNTRRAISYLYHAWYGFPTKHLKMIGVTGTNGKTSVTHMLRAILEASFYRCGLIGTVGCESAGRHLDARGHNPAANMTTPDPETLYRLLSQMVDDGVEYVLMEVTSHALALEKLAPIRFEAAIFTNLTPEHLDFHGTMTAYAEAKSALFSASKLSVLNFDSPYSAYMREKATGRVITCSQFRFADYRAEGVRADESGVEYRLRSDRADMRIQCSIPGGFSVINSMQAACCALELGISAPRVQDALASLIGVRGRMERVKLGFDADFTVLIDYAHTPDALENLLRTAAELRDPRGRTVLLFGCGGDRDKGKRPMMGKIASSNADFVIVTSDNSRSEDPQQIIDEICAGMDTRENSVVIVDRADAIRYAIRNARPGDLILLAGKGHEEYEITREGRCAFSEKKLVREAFAERTRAKD